MNIKDQKIELRKRIEEKRAALGPEERARKEQIINERLIRLCETMLLPASAAAGHPLALFTYMPFRSETDITPVTEWCWGQGVPVLLSRVDRQRKTMSLHEVNSYSQLTAGAWGIREPKPELPAWTDLSRIGLILVPGLAFDKDFGRLGYGGGYYDRFMQLFSPAGLPKPYTAAAAYDVQIVPQVPVSWHDFRVAHLITETLDMKNAGYEK
jgi:5-formyltetrahydrofolate cyclo-ligase